MNMTPSVAQGASCAKAPDTEAIDAYFFDLDGTIYTGGTALPHAVDAVAQATIPVAFITNNASRLPAEVAQALRNMGLNVAPEQIMTSAMAAVAALDSWGIAQRGDRVLVLGTQALETLVADAGYDPVRVADGPGPRPVAVIHGHSPTTGWAELSEAALAIARGAEYVATNLDATLPQERGFMVGNGSMVAAVEHATGIPARSTGKPAPDMFLTAALALGVQRPLCVGDRLNTDIAGANAAGFPTLHVLTGVHGPAALCAAAPHERPTFIANDLRGLRGDISLLRPGPSAGLKATVQPNETDHPAMTKVVIDGGNDAADLLAAVRTVCGAIWHAFPTGSAGEVTVVACSAQAKRAINGWW